MAQTETGRAKDFVETWRGRGDEKADTATFWTDLLTRVLGVPQAEVARGFMRTEKPVKGRAPGSTKPRTRYADVVLPDRGVLIEQKSIDIDLDHARDNGVWGHETPLEQAMWYVSNMRWSDRPRWVVVCNFSTFRIYDLEDDVPEDGMVEVTLEELPLQLASLSFLYDPSASKVHKEQRLSVEAGRRIGRLYDALAACYRHIEDDPEEQRSLNVVITRMVFLLYAEDAGLLQTRTAFGDYCQGNPASLRERLVRLFETVDTPMGMRDEYLDARAAAFPYVNGGLFADRSIVVPQLSDDVAATIAEVSTDLDWSGISPTIFGAVFESTLNPETRREGGMHYTSVENIHKVIGPLFLDGLLRELEEAEAFIDVKRRERKLGLLHDKIANLRFLDPACGSGNFLTETYLQLRRIENRILEDKAGGGQTMLETDGLVRVTLDAFHGIEVNDFAVAVAKTALWIAEAQTLEETQDLFPLLDFDFLPLRSNQGIVEGNAVRMDWNEVLPASECSYVMGNPPFIGYSNHTKEQEADRASIFGKVKTVDYVACWYWKAAEYMGSWPIRAAFVSTNSICQGQQVEPIWKPLFDKGFHIDFAWPSFKWTNEATDQAGVTVVIVGFSKERTKKLIFDGIDTISAENINAYLTASSNVFIRKRSKPLSDVPEMIMGFKPAEHGYLIMAEGEFKAALMQEPDIEKWVRPFSMGGDFIKGDKRFCLWLVEEGWESIPYIQNRVLACEQWRSEQTKTGDAYKLKDVPHLFRQNKKFVDGLYLAVPAVSSEKRDYVPVGFVTNGMIPGNQLYVISNAELYHFGVMTSQFHNAWMRVVAGRLEMRYRYASDIVYNNFVWPDPTDEQRERVEACAQAVLDAREAHEGDSLAMMYDGISPMPADASESDLKKFDQRKYDDLLAAHRALDAAVEAAYGVDFGGDEERIVGHLLKLYVRATAGE